MLSADELGIILLSLKVAGASVLFSLPLALGCALLLARGSFPGKTLFDAVVHLPLVLPPVVIGYALLVLFGRQGVIGALLHDWLGITLAFRWTGAALAAAVMGFPLMVRAMRLSIEAVAPRLEWAARTLGATRWRAFYSVTLPLAMPGIAVGVLLAFARSLGEFGATITFVSNIPGETQTLPLAIYGLTQSPGGDPAILRLCAVSVVLSIAALAASEWINRRARLARQAELA
ncbi:molybdate ABC transporter permease subunit [Casimicrobium huifangae]|jgi:molybdate transport system permease protein|uniref:molybdate ABC transporter permease subunit n=1 Tax=Casimicrobium huifangae TaxID=2591109 RepID=UPI0037833541